MRDHSEKARQVILEIIRQSVGDSVVGTTRLFKAFYFAHLYHLRDAEDFLSQWPIVRMPRGPGIDNFDALLDPLVKCGHVAVSRSHTGPYPTIRYTARRDLPETCLSEEEVKSIHKAVEFIQGKRAARLSEFTHEYSRSWQEAKDGDELRIALDLMTDGDVADARRQQDEIGQLVSDVFG
ncbi:MAG: DUF4065 domain-containing protein [Betaproteobacteria bacterium]|nr:DUF4065 domain-containing protein [Betaproteobacteria bacterium]NCA17516.1 DUF4065 domain-containing protein [Betaproteobacteria bacterium]